MSYRMELRETLSRLQYLHERSGAYYVCTQSGDSSARSRVSKAGRAKPEQTRTEAEAQGQAFRFPRPCRLVRYSFADADQFRVSKRLPTI